MTILFEPITIRNMKLKNRIIMAPMCMYSCDEENGKVMNWHYTHYTSRAVGQVALIIVEATAVRPEGRISVNDLGIWDDEHIAGLQTLTTLIKEQGAKTGIQLAHAGRKSLVPEETFAPSPLAFDKTMKKPTAMTVEHIQEVVQSFKDGALRAKKAGFDVIEIHAAHGYLLNSFLSPLTNKRTDAYGGSPENRYRIVGEIIDAVRSVWDQPLFVRISAHDYTEGGMTAEQYIQFTTWMKTQDVDLIDVSSGAVVPAKIDVYPGYQVPFAETIKKGSNLLTGAVGLITSGQQAEEILKNERADVILVGRELLRDPYWPYTAAKQLKTTITPPKQYDRGWFY